MNSRIALWTLVVAACAWTCAATGRTSAQTEAARAGQQPRVTLPADADISQVVAELARTLDGVVVADAAVKDRRLTEALEEAPLDAALARISVDFDRYCIQRGGSLSLQLRHNDADEPPGAELEELRFAAADVMRLLSRVPQLEGLDYERAKAQFVASITPQQEQKLMEDGIPFPELTDSQRQLLERVNVAHVYGPQIQALRRASLALSSPQRLVIERLETPNGLYLVLRFPDPSSRDGLESLSIRVPRPGVPPARSRLPEGEELQSDPGNSRAWPVELREMSLAQLSAEWRRDTRERLRIPAYAANRRFWIRSVDASRSDTLQALADLWGWESSINGDVRRLARPAFGAASSPVEAQTMVKSAIPPSVRHAVRNLHYYRDQTHRVAELNRVLVGIERVAGAEWSRIRWTRLDADTQHHLALVAFENQVGFWYEERGADTQPRAYLQFPERIVLRLSGPLGSPPPGLSIMVQTERGRRGWAWEAQRRSPAEPAPPR